MSSRKQKNIYTGNPSGSKHTRQELASQGKRIQQQHDPQNYYKMNACWRFHRMCTQTKWSVFNEQWEKHILPKLIDYQGMTWTDIMSASKSHGEGSQSHNVPMEGVTKAGRDELKRLDILCDEVFSLRLSAKERIIGLWKQGVLEILCYDPEHEFVECGKKRT